MSGLLQKADLTMLEEQIQKMQNAYEYAGTGGAARRPDQKRAP